MKKSEVCLKLNNDDGYICSEEWWKVNIKNAVPGVRYTVLSKGFITILRASGTEIVANWISGVGAP